MKRPIPREMTNKTWNGSQSWRNERLYDIDGTSYKTQIRRNAYDFQSNATISRFDGGKWQPVASIAFPLWPADVKALSYAWPGVESAAFDKLTRALLDEAIMVTRGMK